MVKIFISLWINLSLASTLFAPDGDTALLIELVTTTASQLNELELLVSNTQNLLVICKSITKSSLTTGIVRSGSPILQRI